MSWGGCLYLTRICELRLPTLSSYYLAIAATISADHFLKKIKKKRLSKRFGKQIYYKKKEQLLIKMRKNSLHKMKKEKDPRKENHRDDNGTGISCTDGHCFWFFLTIIFIIFSQENLKFCRKQMGKCRNRNGIIKFSQKWLRKCKNRNRIMKFSRKRLKKKMQEQDICNDW